MKLYLPRKFTTRLNSQRGLGQGGNLAQRKNIDLSEWIEDRIQDGAISLSATGQAFDFKNILFAGADGNISQDTAKVFQYDPVLGTLTIEAYGAGGVNPATSGGTYTGNNAIPFMSDEGILTEWLPLDNTKIIQPSLYTRPKNRSGSENSGIFNNIAIEAIDTWNPGAYYKSGLSAGDFAFATEWQSGAAPNFKVQTIFSGNDENVGITKVGSNDSGNYNPGCTFNLSNFSTKDTTPNYDLTAQVAAQFIRPLGENQGVASINFMTAAGDGSQPSLVGTISASTTRQITITGNGAPFIYDGKVQIRGPFQGMTNWYDGYLAKADYATFEHHVNSFNQYGLGTRDVAYIDTYEGNAVDTTVMSDYIAGFSTEGHIVEIKSNAAKATDWVTAVTTDLTAAAQAAGVTASLGLRFRITSDDELQVLGRLNGIVTGTPYVGNLIDASWFTTNGLDLSNVATNAVGGEVRGHDATSDVLSVMNVNSSVLEIAFKADATTYSSSFNSLSAPVNTLSSVIAPLAP